MRGAVEMLEDKEEDGFSTFKIKQNEIVIFGRPIRLADVLLAIDCIVRKIFVASPIMVDEDSSKVIALWTEETIEFLYELLTSGDS